MVRCFVLGFAVMMVAYAIRDANGPALFGSAGLLIGMFGRTVDERDTFRLPILTLGILTAAMLHRFAIPESWWIRLMFALLLLACVAVGHRRDA